MSLIDKNMDLDKTYEKTKKIDEKTKKIDKKSKKKENDITKTTDNTNKNKQELLNRIELLKNKDYSFLYPNLDDPNFNIKIAEKREFYDTRYENQIKNLDEEVNRICNIPPELAPHQQFVKNFLSFQTPYNSLLLYHGLGTGKTCAAITVAEEQRDYLMQLNINQKIIVVASPNVQDNFIIQLFDERKLELVNGLWNIKDCIGNKFLQEINPVNTKGLSRDKVIRMVKNIISNYYLFVGYVEFANLIFKKSTIDGKDDQKIIKSKLKKYFNNRLIIIDEIHNIRISDENISTSNKRVAQELFKLVKNVDNLRLLLLSATPMFNSYKEIIWLINLMNLNDRRSLINIKDVFDDDGSFLIKDGQEVGKELLERKCIGYISYVKGENPYSFPYKIWPDNFSKSNTLKEFEYPKIQLNSKPIIQKIEYLSLYLSKIGEYQNKIYNFIIDHLNNQIVKGSKSLDFQDMEKFGYVLLQKPIEALNIVYPNDNIDDVIIEKNYDYSIKDLVGKNGLSRIMSYKDSSNPFSKSNFKYKDLSYGRIFSPNEIGKYSNKIKNICSNIINSEGIVLIYSQFIDGGVVPIALALEEMGFTRYGSTKSLFNEPPVPLLDVNTYLPFTESNTNFKPAKYIAITGDKHFSPNNILEIKAATDKDNINGEKIKVILISQAGSEGIDFKCIRQVHILEPWYNMNRIEQIIGRAVRNCSHKDLDFIDRNVEIFLHGTILSNDLEAADLYVYRLAELKAVQIGNVTRVLKEISVDCLLNTNLNNLNANILDKIVKQKLSNKLVIDYKVGDKPFSAICDYMNSCEYKCKPFKELNNEDINNLSYTQSFIITNNEKIIERIKYAFKENYFYYKDQLIALINLYKNYSLMQIDAALTQLIENKTDYLVDKYNRLGYLINIDNLYLFQPIELTNTNISLFDRDRPLNYKRDNLLLNKPFKDILSQPIKIKNPIKLKLIKDEDKMLKQEEIPKDNIVSTIAPINYSEEVNNLLTIIENDYITATTEQIVLRGEKNYYKYVSLVFDNLKEKIDEKILHTLILEHILELLTFDETFILLNYLYFNTLNNFESKIKNYYDNNILDNSKKNIKGIMLNNLNKLQLVILSSDKWNNAESEDYEDLREQIQKMIIVKENFNNIVGFIGNFKNLFNIFKVKLLDKKRHKGARCDQSSKSDSITLLNKILTENIYTSENTKKINHVEICVYQEIYLRYFNYIKKNNKIWFLNSSEGLINDIENISL